MSRSDVTCPVRDNCRVNSNFSVAVLFLFSKGGARKQLDAGKIVVLFVFERRKTYAGFRKGLIIALFFINIEFVYEKKLVRM